MKKNIVFFHMSYRSDWEKGMVNRNYFIFQELVKKNIFDSIVSIDFLPFSLKKVAKVFIQQKPFKKKSNTLFHSFHTAIEKDMQNPALFHVKTIDQRYIKSVLQKLNIDPENTIFWSYTPFSFEVLDQYKKSVHIFDAVDNWMLHPSYKKQIPRLKQAYHAISKKADIIFSVSDTATSLFEKDVFVIPNGVDAHHFAPKKKRKEKKEIRIGYHGIIQSRFDVELVKKIIALRPEYHFDFIGPIWREMEAEMHQLQDAYNTVTLKGPISYQDLPTHIDEWDAAIIPHITTGLTQSMNPMKIYEYLASGKPIVSTPIAGIERFQKYITVFQTADEGADALDHVLSQDTKQLQKERIAAVMNDTWEKRVSTMLNHIEKSSRFI